MKVKDIIKKPEGYTGKLIAKELDLEIPIRYKRITAKDILPTIIFKDEEGKEVERKYIGEPRHLEWRRKENGEPAVGNIQAYQVLDGKEIPVKPFERTETIEIKKFVPYEMKENFLVEKVFELWSEEADIIRLAKYMIEKDVIGLCVVVPTKSYYSYLGIIEARTIENKIGFLLSLTQKELTFSHLTEIAQVEKTKKTTPQIQIFEILK